MAIKGISLAAKGALFLGMISAVFGVARHYLRRRKLNEFEQLKDRMLILTYDHARLKASKKFCEVKGDEDINEIKNKLKTDLYEEIFGMFEIDKLCAIPDDRLDEERKSELQRIITEIISEVINKAEAKHNEMVASGMNHHESISSVEQVASAESLADSGNRVKKDSDHTPPSTTVMPLSVAQSSPSTGPII